MCLTAVAYISFREYTLFLNFFYAFFIAGTYFRHNCFLYYKYIIREGNELLKKLFHTHTGQCKLPGPPKSHFLLFIYLPFPSNRQKPAVTPAGFCSFCPGSMLSGKNRCNPRLSWQVPHRIQVHGRLKECFPCKLSAPASVLPSPPHPDGSSAHPATGHCSPG